MGSRNIILIGDLAQIGNLLKELAILQQRQKNLSHTIFLRLLQFSSIVNSVSVVCFHKELRD